MSAQPILKKLTKSNTDIDSELDNILRLNAEVFGLPSDERNANSSYCDKKVWLERLDQGAVYYISDTSKTSPACLSFLFIHSKTFDPALNCLAVLGDASLAES